MLKPCFERFPLFLTFSVHIDASRGTILICWTRLHEHMSLPITFRGTNQYALSLYFCYFLTRKDKSYGEMYDVNKCI